MHTYYIAFVSTSSFATECLTKNLLSLSMNVKHSLKVEGLYIVYLDVHVSYFRCLPKLKSVGLSQNCLFRCYPYQK